MYVHLMYERACMYADIQTNTCKYIGVDFGRSAKPVPFLIYSFLFIEEWGNAHKIYRRIFYIVKTWNSDKELKYYQK